MSGSAGITTRTGELALDYFRRWVDNREAVGETRPRTAASYRERIETLGTHLRPAVTLVGLKTVHLDNGNDRPPPPRRASRDWTMPR